MSFSIMSGTKENRHNRSLVVDVRCRRKEALRSYQIYTIIFNRIKSK